MNPIKVKRRVPEALQFSGNSTPETMIRFARASLPTQKLDVLSLGNNQIRIYGGLQTFLTIERGDWLVNDAGILKVVNDMQFRRDYEAI